MKPGLLPIESLPSLSQEPPDIRDQRPVLLSAFPVVSYRSGRPRSWPNSWLNTPMPPFSGSVV
jgi:hypothetical protein